MHSQCIVTSTADSRRFSVWLVDLADKIYRRLSAAHASGMAGSAAFRRRFGARLDDLADKIYLQLIAACASGMAGLAAFQGDNLWFLWTLQLCD